jgi:hypothetical protein
VYAYKCVRKSADKERERERERGEIGREREREGGRERKRDSEIRRGRNDGPLTKNKPKQYGQSSRKYRREEG